VHKHPVPDMMIRFLRRWPLTVALLMFMSAVSATEAAALQASGLGSQTLRPYWHVFVAYAVVIIMIGAWAFSISRRLKNVEDRLVD
jgi:hypothetical protein